jgi:hypothetical protein
MDIEANVHHDSGRRLGTVPNTLHQTSVFE